MALMNLMDKIAKFLENGEFFIEVFVDFSKAIDAATIDISLKKLSHCGNRGPSLKWFHSYLEGRSHYVTYNGVESSKRIIKCGVPEVLF